MLNKASQRDFRTACFSPCWRRYAYMKLSAFILVFLLEASNAAACQPSYERKPTLKKEVYEAFRQAQHVAFVYVAAVEESENKFNVHFRVLESFKGAEEEFSTGWVAQCCQCQMHFKTEAAYIVYAVLSPKETLFISTFGPSKALNEVTPKELKYLRTLRNSNA